MALRSCWPDERRSLRDPITGTRIEQLTAYPANHWHLTAPDFPLTPSGEFLLFTSNRGAAPSPDLFRLEMRTGVIEQVTDGWNYDPEGVTPAANGRQVIAVLPGEDGEVVALDLDSGEWETLAVFPGARLDGCHRSASGEYVVTVVIREGEATITAVHAEGMRTVPIRGELRGATAARFSPDSKNSVSFVCTATETLRAVEFDGSGERELGSGVQAFRHSGVQGRPSASTSTTQTPESPNTRTPERLNACPPSWLGSGEEVLFVAGSGPGPLMGAPRRGGSPRVVFPHPCEWARSNGAGDWVVAQAGDTILLLGAHSGEVRALCSGQGAGARPCFTPDGGSIVFSARDEHGWVQLSVATVG